MHHPYAEDSERAFAAAQAALALTWCAVLVRRRELGAGVVPLLCVAFVVAAATPFAGEQLAGGSFRATGLGLWLASALLTVIAWWRGRRIRLACLAAGAFAALAALHFVWVDAARELAMLHLTLQGALLGYALREPTPTETERTRMAAPRDDLVFFAVATLLGAFVSSAVFARTSVMDDEWAYTFQADLFAHLRAYAPAPSCASPFENNWLFTHEGRTFSQFTPGWPLFMAPFTWFGGAWLASSVSLGLLVVGVAHLCRRLVSVAGDSAATRRRVRAAGALGAIGVGTGASVLLNAGTRFSHVFVAAMFAWAVEAACVLTSDPRVSGRRLGWSVALGTCAAALISARVPDGLLLNVGIGLVILHAALRGRTDRVELLVAALVFGAWLALTLAILRLQLGVWFRTGYALTDQLRPWSRFVLSAPAANEWQYALPLGAAAYCWWPCAPALGAAGLMAARRSGPASFMLACGAVLLLAFYVFVEFGRLHYWAYGPRYQLPATVAFSVGGAVWLSRLFDVAAPGRERLVRSLIGLVALAGSAALVCIGFELYPAARREAHARTALFRALARERIHRAVVWVGNGELGANPTALTQNLATDDDPDVIILIRDTRATIECARRAFPERRFYRALGLGEVTLVPE